MAWVLLGLAAFALLLLVVTARFGLRRRKSEAGGMSVDDVRRLMDRAHHGEGSLDQEDARRLMDLNSHGGW